MKNSLKKFFLLGLTVAAAAVAIKEAPKIKKAINELIRKKKLSKEDGTVLHADIVRVLEKKSAKKSKK
ncbi:MAG: hypothetical protein ABIJ34_07090 [archaeon]